MKKSKFILRVMLCLLALTVVLAGCNKTPDESTGGTTNPSVGETSGYLVTFQDTPAVTFQSDLTPGQTVEEGTVVTFTMTVSGLYEGTPVVKAGDQELTADENGKYSFTVTADTTITVEGLTLIVSAMEGDGSEDEPYQITNAVDLIFIAEQINAGNESYITAYYSLENDIDCEGVELGIIGDASMDTALFAGYFDGNGYTVSNFVINSNSSQYVGFFGVVQSDMAGGSGGTVYDLHLDSFTITASITDQGAFVGSMAGYGMGANLILCSATNGTINFYGDSNSFSYVGGLMGIQQALDYSSVAYYSAISYCYSDVEVNCNSGQIYAAGGLVGYTAQSSNEVNAYINNSYALGGVYGAMNAGGLVGYMGSGTSIINSYAVGPVIAQSTNVDTVNGEEFCYAYAGGLVGYAAANTVVAECFSASELQAVASVGAKYQVTSGTVAYLGQPEEYDFGYEPATVYNCVYALGGADGEIDLTSGAYLQKTLNWNEIDWVFTDGAYPVFNLDQSDEAQDEAENYTFNVTIRVDDEDTVFTIKAQYATLQFWYADGALPSRVLAKENSTRITCGYYFDEELTQAIPDGYIPTHDIIIYTKVADVAEVAGTYEVVVDGATKIQLILNTDGTCTYTDGGQTNVCGYYYDGETVLFEYARLGRFTANGDMMSYQFYDFLATVEEDGSLTIIGGVYTNDDSEEVVIFTAKNPLVAVPVNSAISGVYADGVGFYTFYADGTGCYESDTDWADLTYVRSGSDLTVELDDGTTLTGTIAATGITLGDKTLNALDIFAGSWSVDSKANKVYTFDGAGNWSYAYYGYNANGDKSYLQRKSGTYTIDENGILTLSGDITGIAKFVDGVLNITVDGQTLTCHKDGSYYGTWFYVDYGMTLKLNGITADGTGTARAEFLYSSGIVEGYDLVCALDDINSNRLCLYMDGEVFGYMSYSALYDRLIATIYIGPEGNFMSNVYLAPMDDLEGEWVGDLNGMTGLTFNGYGAYNSYGTVTIGQDEIHYTLSNATLEGTFTYNDAIYNISYNEFDGTLTVTDGTNSCKFCRKDAFGDLTLTDGKGNYYTFDGRTSLSGAFGTMYLNGNAVYTYLENQGDLTLYANGEQVGTLTIANNAYLLKIDGQSDVSLGIHTKFTGAWAMSGSLTNMTIGTMGIDGTLNGVVINTNVVLTMEADGTLSFTYQDTIFYVIWLDENNVVVSQYKEWYYYGNQIYCSPCDEMFGAWKESILDSGYQFDGMSNSDYTSGMAQSGIFVGGAIPEDSGTSYYYSLSDQGYYILWTYSTTTGETLISRLIWCNVDTMGAFVNEAGDKAFYIEEGNALYKTEVTDSDGITWKFDGFGVVTTSAGDTGTYELLSDIDYTNGIANVKITINGKSYRATIDFSDAANSTIELVEI